METSAAELGRVVPVPRPARRPAGILRCSRRAVGALLSATALAAVLFTAPAEARDASGAQPAGPTKAGVASQYPPGIGGYAPGGAYNPGGGYYPGGAYNPGGGYYPGGASNPGGGYYPGPGYTAGGD